MKQKLCRYIRKSSGGMLTFIIGLCLISFLMLSPTKHSCPEKNDITHRQQNVVNLKIPTESRLSTVYSDSPRHQRGYLTIGIPTVHRNRTSYLDRTIRSLLNNSGSDEIQHRVTIVILFADLNHTNNIIAEKKLVQEFKRYIDSGIILVVYVPNHYYPDFDSLKITFGDPIERVKWRSKQNLDYAFLMSYSADISQYYMQIEDDVIAAPGYVQKIKDFINDTKSYWVMLDMSDMGFIGKLFRSSDIPKLSIILQTFFNEQPCDFLLVYFLRLMLQTRRFVRVPKLFKHLGIHSSLVLNKRDEDQSLFEGEMDVLRGDNPGAKVFTSLESFRGYTLDKLYNPNFGNIVFWAKTPVAGDTIVIYFNKNQTIGRILVVTGFPRRNKDQIDGAILEVGRHVFKSKDNTLNCVRNSHIGDFDNGRIDVKLNKVDSTNISCIKITITTSHLNWVLFRQFAVYVR